MEADTDEHNPIAHGGLAQAQEVFDDPAAFDAGDEVFNRNAPLGNDPITGFLVLRERLAPRLLRGLGDHHPLKRTALKPQILEQLAASG